MFWTRMKLRQQKVWAECDEEGALIQNGGRVSIRYSADENARVYQASARNLAPIAGEQERRSFPQGEVVAPSSSSRGQGLGSAKSRTEAQRERAVEVASELIASFPEESFLLFTDGSCQGNPGPAGVGVFLKSPEGELVEHRRFLGRATNNIAELSAILDAIELVEQRLEGEIWPPVKIMTDSQYARGVLTQNWKAKANKELVMSLREKLRMYPSISIHWVAGHAGIDENEQADRLANEALELGDSCA